jgi:hypothetical protein
MRAKKATKAKNPNISLFALGIEVLALYSFTHKYQPEARSKKDLVMANRRV